jgi:SET domain-containing protein
MSLVLGFLECIYKSKKSQEIIRSEGKSYTVDVTKLNFLSEIFPFKLDKVKVGPSKVHGRGVFAKRKISKDELITFYPGDIVEYTPHGDRWKDNHITVSYSSRRFEDEFGKEAVKDVKYRNNDYAFSINSHYTVIGHPAFDQDPTYFGHFINDGAKSNSTELSDQIYIKISLMKQNCQFYPYSGEMLHVPIVATRDIEEGEELFIHYTTLYWQSFNRPN